MKLNYYTSGKSLASADFKNLLTHYGIIDETLKERDISLAYNLSMKIQVDEIYSPKILQMCFEEFCEAICRIAERISLLPYGQSY
jgi:hypothetical protein